MRPKREAYPGLMNLNGYEVGRVEEPVALPSLKG